MIWKCLGEREHWITINKWKGVISIIKLQYLYQFPVLDFVRIYLFVAATLSSPHCWPTVGAGACKIQYCSLSYQCNFTLCEHRVAGCIYWHLALANFPGLWFGAVLCKKILDWHPGRLWLKSSLLFRLVSSKYSKLVASLSHILQRLRRKHENIWMERIEYMLFIWMPCHMPYVLW